MTSRTFSSSAGTISYWCIRFDLIWNLIAASVWEYGWLMLSHRVNSRLFHTLLEVRSIWCLRWHSVVALVRLSFFFYLTLHRRHLLNLLTGLLLLLWSGSYFFLRLRLFRCDTFKIPSLSPLVFGTEVLNYVIDRLCVSIFWESLYGSQARLLDIHFILRTAKHALMMDKNFLWESLKDPLMLQRF